MSSAATAADEVTLPSDTIEKAPRRFPAPCWTQEEVLALIDAYRERWYALRRGYLRTADWDEVATAVISRCPRASSAKTSAQCRHKMEKLRQRYRAEKRRSLSFPYPAECFFSSWVFFETMEAMENGTAALTSVQNSSNGSGFKSIIDQNLFKVKLKTKNNPESDPDLGFDNSVRAKRFSSATKIPSHYSPYSDMDIADKDEEDVSRNDDFTNRGMRSQPMNRISIQIPPPLKSKSKKSGKIFNNVDASAGFRQQTPPPVLRIKEFGFDLNRSNPNEDFWMKFSNSDRNRFVDPSMRAKCLPNVNPDSDSRAAKRGKNGLEEIVSSIKVLGEGLLKMEQEKMEMARAMESVRMEMEIKRNQLLLESQKQIVDAFLKGLLELKKSKKVKSGGAADPAER